MIERLSRYRGQPPISASQPPRRGEYSYSHTTAPRGLAVWRFLDHRRGTAPLQNRCSSLPSPRLRAVGARQPYEPLAGIGGHHRYFTAPSQPSEAGGYAQAQRYSQRERKRKKQPQKEREKLLLWLDFYSEALLHTVRIFSEALRHEQDRQSGATLTRAASAKPR